MHKIIIINVMCPPLPQSERPKFYSWSGNDESSRKCRKACEACGEILEIRDLNEHMGFDKLQLILEGCPKI